MKKISSFAIGFLILCSAKAQDTKKFSLGFKIAPNFSWVSVQEGPMVSNGMGLGFSYGLTMDYNILNSSNYWLSTELDITSLPSKVKHSGDLKGSSNNNATYKDVTFDYSNQYLQIPISFKFKTDESDGLRYYFQMGLGLSFLTKAKVATGSNPNIYDKNGNPGLTYHDPNNSSNSIYDFDGGPQKEVNYTYLDDVNSFRSSLILGAGIEHKVSQNVNFVAGLKFDNGFRDFLADTRVNARNNFLSLQVGFTF